MSYTKLISDYGEAEFTCGEWSDGDEPDYEVPYLLAVKLETELTETMAALVGACQDAKKYFKGEGVEAAVAYQSVAAALRKAGVE